MRGLSNFPFAVLSAAKGKFPNSAPSASLRLAINKHFIVRQSSEYLVKTNEEEITILAFLDLKYKHRVTPVKSVYVMLWNSPFRSGPSVIG